MDKKVKLDKAAPAPPPRVIPKNPMEIEAILSHLFDEFYFSADDLKNFRLVNTEWKHAMSSRWKRLSLPVKLRQDDARKSVVEADTTTAVSSFLEENRKTNETKKPQHFFILEGWTIKDEHLSVHVDGDIKNAVLHRFWMSHGRYIKKIVLDACLLPFSHTLLTETIWAALPNLEDLLIKHCKFDCGNDLQEPALEEEEEMVEDLDNYRLGFGDNKRRRVEYICKRTEDAKRIQVEWTEASAPTHVKLKSLWLEDIEEKDNHDTLIIHWAFLTTIFPNLRKLGVRRVITLEVGGWLQNQGNLRILNLMSIAGNEFESSILSNLKVKWNDLRLDSLALSCDGYIIPAEKVLLAITSQRETLRKLEMRLTSYPGVAFPTLPCNALIPNLAELRLNGNVSQNLDFLQFMPELKILIWNNKYYCSDESYERVCQRSKMGIFFQNSEKIVENTKALDDNFRLTHLHTLELDWGPRSPTCWQRLGNWTPNVKNLKGVVNGDGQFAQIAAHLPQLENLEMAHGSNVTANGILNVLLTQKSLQQLRSFTWKPCDCIISLFEDEEFCAVQELKNRVGRNFILPWMGGPLGNQGDNKQPICAQWLD